MIVVTKNAEETFLATLDRFQSKSGDQRCLFLRYSQIPEAGENWFFELCDALEKISNGHISQVYLCQDRDVFVLMPHIASRQIQRLPELLQSSLSKLDFDKFCTLHEIKIDISTIKAICRRKLELIQKSDEAERRTLESQQEAAKRTAMLADISPDILSTLTERRNKREYGEIMVVEDDALARMMIKNVLIQDYNVHAVNDAHTALLDYAEYAPDVLFLDIGLPDMCGHQVLEHIIQIDPDACVIMFSGRKDQDNVLRALNAGAIGFVGKPFTRGKLFQYIEQSPTIQSKKQKGRPAGTQAI